MEKIAETINGLQHIGLPTNDLEKTVAFYEGLGFSVALRTVNEAAGEQVAFLQLKELMINYFIFSKQQYPRCFFIKSMNNKNTGIFIFTFKILSN